MRFWPILALVFMIFADTLPAANAQTRTEPTIGGMYRIADGIDEDGFPYGGAVKIQREGNGYRFDWVLEDGTTLTGKGLRNGNRITVYYGDPDPAVYQIGANGVLRGTYGPGGRARETLYPN